MGTSHIDWDEEYSVISDKGDVGFLDFEDDKSFHNIDPLDEDGPVVISYPFPLVSGKPTSALIGERTAYAINIKNTTYDHVDLWSVRISSENPEGTYLLSLMKPPASDANQETICSFVASTTLEERTLQPRETFIIWLSCKPKEIGLHTGVVHVNVGDEIVERVAFILAEDKVSQALFSTRPYSSAPRRGRRSSYDQYVAGSRPAPAPTQGFFKNKLPQYSIPKDIREIVENKQAPDVITEGLNDENYARYFRTLIVMEEIHLEEEMRAHDMECVSLRRRGKYFLSLEVPGLAERRPSLVYGDYILAQLVTNDPVHGTPAYQGFIHRVEADEIFLKFDKRLHACHQDSDLYNVSFTYNRINMRRLYLAIDAAEYLGRNILFPSQLSYRVIKPSSFVPLNPHINKEQALSVKMILGCRGGEPYIILGPPGTGKTMTIVEAILQIYTNRKRARILVCASSNSAADHVLEKLLDNERVKVRENEIFRLNATRRPYDDIKPDFLRFCFFDDTVFQCPPLKALFHYRIIISTYMSSSLLYAEGIPRGHFSHIFLDEAGQASEPETMVPISNMCEKNSVIVLAGDPKQLGPVIYSRHAESYGLGKSYMERLFDCEGYEDADENYVTKLVRNYRSHPSILELPSKLFYRGELVACKEEDESDIFDSFELPNKAFPVLFVGIQGCDEREGSNPSWFNRIEASKVVEIIRKLMGCTDLDESDIGVITPYRQQVLKLKKALEVLEMPDVKVGSVEQFQGQERQVIIISTVRSTVKHNEFDRVHSLGFLSNPRRFNVAITRARSLLVIVGNPHILTKDPHWDSLLRHCADNGSYQGCPLPPPEDNYPVAEEAEYDSGQPHYNDNERGDVPHQLNDVNGWDESERDNNAAKPYCNEDGWGDCASQSYNNEAGWSNSVPNQYNGSGCDDNHPKVQATGWDNFPPASGWDDMPPPSGWDD